MSGDFCVTAYSAWVGLALLGWDLLCLSGTCSVGWELARADLNGRLVLSTRLVLHASVLTSHAPPHRGGLPIQVIPFRLDVLWCSPSELNPAFAPYFVTPAATFLFYLLVHCESFSLGPYYDIAWLARARTL